MNKDLKKKIRNTWYSFQDSFNPLHLYEVNKNQAQNATPPLSEEL